MNLLGTNIGSYQIDKELGRGGTSIVYQAVDLRSQEEVALKVMLPELINNEMALKRFMREGKAASKLQHPNIVQIYEAGQADGHYFIAMQLIKGGTLADYIRQVGELLSAEQAIAILSQIGAALDHAHSQGIVHRDLKLSNILLADQEKALLSDFGIAKHLFSEQTMVTAVGRAVGTPSFMSPEQITGDTEIDYRSDIYSLGVIAYLLFTGRTPFTGDTAPQLMYKIAYDPPISPEVINPELSSEVAHVLLKALSKDPNERYTSAHRFVTSLSSCQSYGGEVNPYQNAVVQPTLKSAESIIFQWPFTHKVPLEAFAGALISLLVLLIAVSPSLSVTPKFLLTKLQEIDMLQSMRLAVAPRDESITSVTSLNSVQASSISPMAKDLYPSQLEQPLPDLFSKWISWETFDAWTEEGYNMILTFSSQNQVTLNDRLSSSLTQESIPYSKPDLPNISPKILP